MRSQIHRYLVLPTLVSIVTGFGLAAGLEPVASQPAHRQLRGRVESIDPAARQITILWRHPRQPTTMPLPARLAADVQVAIDGKPTALADVRPGDLVHLTGRAGLVEGRNAFVVSLIEVSRATATASAPASAPAPALVAADVRVDTILTQLERRGEQIKDIQAEISFTKTDQVIEDKQVFKGILRFKEEKPNPRFFIRFDKFIQEGVEREKKEWHVFDGEWYIEAREKTSTIVKRQIVRPGEQVNVFRIGQGPFPLPFGQKKADILQNFDVKLIDPQPTDPKNTDHLECTPKPDTDMA
ncbi:MAG: hypothetical protein HY718_16705, partial [Planctomycetes bacterium]|nr:hypothetical protein [Planctomycetota bacterium]